MKRLGALTFLLLLCPGIAAAQEIQGVVRDSASERPIAGAVVTVLGAGSAARARGVTNIVGEYRLPIDAGALRIRVVRIGFAPVERAIAPVTERVMRVDLVMRSLPRLLDAIHVRDNPLCPARSDRSAAFALWEQAQAVLLVAVVGSQTNPPRFVHARFERIMIGMSKRIEDQSVLVDTSAAPSTSFIAAMSATKFIEQGFVSVNGDRSSYFAPDALTLLDDNFGSAYCFSLHARDSERPTQIGLVFEPAYAERGRIDIRGTLWLDTAARELRMIEYRYVGLPAAAERAQPGGYVSFRAMQNGQVLVDRWSLRTPDTRVDTSSPSHGGSQIQEHGFASEGGGELIDAVWPDGTAWHATLGTLMVQLHDSLDKPPSGMELRLKNTNYSGRPDARGVVEIRDLIAGPYSAVLVDSTLATLGMALPTSLTFVAERDSLVLQACQLRNRAHMLRSD
jgi:hypothetical protein